MQVRKKKGYAERIAGVIAIFELQLARWLSNVFIKDGIEVRPLPIVTTK